MKLAKGASSGAGGLAGFAGLASAAGVGEGVGSLTRLGPQGWRDSTLSSSQRRGLVPVSPSRCHCCPSVHQSLPLSSQSSTDAPLVAASAPPAVS